MQNNRNGPVRVVQSIAVNSASMGSPNGRRKAMNQQKALYWAMTDHDVNKIFELLTTHAVDVDERDRACGMQTVLMRLCHLNVREEERATLLNSILNLHPDVNIRDSSGRTALVHACIAENIDIIQCLSELADCDPSLGDNDGNTPLMYAVRSRKPNLVRTLLRCFYGRLDPDAINYKGVTALAEAESRDDIEIVRILVSEGGAKTYLAPLVPPSARATPLSPASSHGGSMAKGRMENLPPTALPHRQKLQPDVLFSPKPSEGLFSPRTNFTPASRQTSSIFGDSSGATTPVLFPLQKDNRRHTIPKKTLKKDKNDTHNLKDENHSKVMKTAFSFPNLQNVNGSLVTGINSTKDETQSDEDVGNKGKTENITKENCVFTPRPTQDNPSTLPQVREETGNREEPAKKGRKGRRKNSASLPNISNTSLLSPNQNALRNEVESASKESRILDWEQGTRTSYRKESDFRLPPLNMTSLTGALSSTER